MTRIRTLSIVFAAALALAAPTLAQTVPSILIDPWPDQHLLAQTNDQLSYLFNSHVREDDSDISTFRWDSTGRVKFDREDTDPQVLLGYRLLTMSVDAERSDLNGVYNDLAIVGGWQAGRVGDSDEWRIGVLGGVGSANDNHWQNHETFYGVGAVNFSHTLSETEDLHVGLSYDGNRSLLPDVPLPYLSYVNKTDKDLVYVLGVPASSVVWKPIDKLTLTGRYEVPLNFGGEVAYAFCDKLSVFTAYQHTLDAFHEHDAANRDDRLFYGVHTVRAGVRTHVWILDVETGAGLAFGQKFSRGWDLRDDDTVAEPGDALLIFLTLGGTF